MLLWLCALSLTACALDAQGTVTISYRLGFDSIVPHNKPAPLTILVENGTAESIQISVRLVEEQRIGGSSGQPHVFSISPGVGKQFTMLVNSDISFNSALEFNADREVLWMNKDVGVAKDEASRQFKQTITIGRETVTPIVVMGGRARQLVSALGGGIRGGNLRESTDEQGREVWFCELDQKYAPDSELGWAGVSLVIWTEPDPTGWGDESQFEALKRWLACGGQLVILSATQPRLLSATEISPLLPVVIDGVKTVPYPTVPIEGNNNWVRKPKGDSVHFLPPGHRPQDKWLGDATGPHLQAKSDPSAIFAPPETNWGSLGVLGWQRRFGAGRVFVAAYDPLVYDRGDRFPLLQATAVVAGLNFPDQASFEHGRTQPGSVYTARMRDIRKFLTHGNVLELSLGPYILMAVMFLVLIGPADYLLLARFKKLKYSAFTLVAYALLFSGAAVVATYFLFAPSPQTNRIAYVDFTELEDGTEHASGYVLHGTYRPLGDAYTCDLQDCLVFGTLPSGEQVKTATTGPGGGYVGPGRQPLHVDQPFNSFRMVQTRFAGKPSGTVSAQIVENGTEWALDVTNGLDATLYTATLRLATRAVPVPQIDPGQTVRVSFGRKEWQSINYIDARSARRIPTSEGKQVVPEALAEFLLFDAVTGTNTGDSAMPWELRLAPGEAVFYALTTAYPFTDSFGQDDTGFNVTLVRRRIAVPASLQSALKEPRHD